MVIGRKLNVSLIEIDIIWNNKEANIKQLEDSIQKLPKGTDIVILPELFSTGFNLEDANTMINSAERNTQETIQIIKQLSSKYHIAIAGSFMAKTADKIYNRAFFIESSGEETFYDKRHIFSIGGEQDIFTAGTKVPPIIRYRGWNIMLSICYDLRFPVWLNNSNCKYDMLIIVANWPKARDYVWQHLLIARAIENECYVCGCNRIGNSPSGIEYIGNSMVIDFRGQIVSNKSDNIISATLSSEKLLSFRQNFPVWKDFDEFKLI